MKFSQCANCSAKKMPALYTSCKVKKNKQLSIDLKEFKRGHYSRLADKRDKHIYYGAE